MPPPGTCASSTSRRISPARIKQAFDALAKSGATRYVVDLRGTARGDLDEGVAAARLFVRSGTLSVKQTKTGRDVVTAQLADARHHCARRAPRRSGDGRAPRKCLPSALDGNERAELIGERTLGRAARQQLVKLPDGSGLLLSIVRYLTPKNEGIHERGLGPDVEVDQPDVEFGATPPAKDDTLDKALERLAEKKAA